MAISLIWQEIRRYGKMAIPPCFSLYYHINPPRGGIVISDTDISLLPIDGLEEGSGLLFVEILRLEKFRQTLVACCKLI